MLSCQTLYFIYIFTSLRIAYHTDGRMFPFSPCMLSTEKNKWAHDVIFIANFLDNLRDHS